MEKTIKERQEETKLFRNTVKGKYPLESDIPIVKIGDTVNTVFGIGKVISVYTTKLSKTAYPTVKYKEYPLTTCGDKFDMRELLMYPYDYDLIP